MLARGLTTQTIEGRCRVLRRFQEYAGTFPWTWWPVDLDDYKPERRSCGEADQPHDTALGQQRDRDVLCLHLFADLWLGKFCELTLSDVPTQIVFNWNTPRHRATRPTMQSRHGGGSVLPGRIDGQPACRRCSGVKLNVGWRTCGAEDELYRGSRCWSCDLEVLVDSLLTNPETGVMAAELVPMAQALKSMKRSNSGVTWTLPARTATGCSAGAPPGSHIQGSGLRSRLETVFNTRAAGLGTLHELTKLGPVPILADVLGYHPSTIERHAIGAASVYSQYIATRRTMR